MSRSDICDNILIYLNRGFISSDISWQNILDSSSNRQNLIFNKSYNESYKDILEWHTAHPDACYNKIRFVNDLNFLNTTYITNLSDNQILRYDSSTGKWLNETLVDNDTDNLQDLTDVNITSLVNGEILKYNSTSSEWENSPHTLWNLDDVAISSLANNEILKYNSGSGNWENNNLLINEINDVNINNLQNNEVLKYNSSTGRWENSDRIDALDELGDVTLTGSSNNQVLKYNGSIWVNAFVNLTELADTNITSLTNGDILRYNSGNTAWETSTLTINDLDDVNITSLANNQVLKYNSTTGKWINSERIDTLDELGDVTLTGVTTGDLLRYNGANFVNTKIALNNDFTNVNFTSLTNGDLIKYNGNNFVNFSPTYLDGALINNNFLIKVVGGAAVQTTFQETSVASTSTSLQTYIPSGALGVLAGSIETEIFDTTKTRMHLTSKGINTASGITVTSDGRVGIGIVEPEEDLEVDGSIQIDSANVARLKFQKSGASPHAEGEIDAETDGTNGGQIEFYTKVDGGSVTEKLRINNQGAIGIGGKNFGTTNQVIVSNGSGSSVSWADQTDTTYSPGTGVTINGSNVISIGQAVGTSDSPSFAQLKANEPGLLVDRLFVRNTSTQYMYYNIAGNLIIEDAESQGVGIVVGSAYGRPGLYSNDSLTLQSQNTGIIFANANVERMIMNATGTTVLQSTAGGCSFSGGDSVFNNVRIGEFYTGYVGIAHNSLSQTNQYAILQQNNGTTYVNAATGTGILFRMDNGANKMVVNDNGVGVNSYPSTSFPFYVNGTCASTGFNAGWGGASWFGNTAVGNILPILNADSTYNIGSASARYNQTFSAAFLTTSDDRLKINETHISNGLDTIMKLKPTTYDFMSSEEPNAKHLGLRSGFIAQEVLEIEELKHVVNVPENETEKVEKEVDQDGNIVDSDKERKCYLSVDYVSIFTYSVRAIQELSAKVTALEARLAAAGIA